MITNYTFVFSAVISKDIEIPDGMSTESEEFTELLSSAVEGINLNDFADLEDAFPTDEEYTDHSIDSSQLS